MARFQSESLATTSRAGQTEPGPLQQLVDALRGGLDGEVFPYTDRPIRGETIPEILRRVESDDCFGEGAASAKSRAAEGQGRTALRDEGSS